MMVLVYIGDRAVGDIDKCILYMICDYMFIIIVFN